VYFCFHQERDEDRARFVSACTATVDSNRFSDWTDESWQAAHVAGPESLTHLIDEKLADTHVSCLLIGERTFEKPWILPMLSRSYALGRGILAIHVHNVPDRNGQLVSRGASPMGRLNYRGRDNQEYPFTSYFHTYEWEFGKGEAGMPGWVALAARQAGMDADG
jgi:hypothetical protein